MAKYRVYAVETVYSFTELEADSREDAMDKAWTMQSDYTFQDYDGDGFEIYDADLVEEEWTS